MTKLLSLLLVAVLVGNTTTTPALAAATTTAHAEKKLSLLRGGDGSMRRKLQWTPCGRESCNQYQDCVAPPDDGGLKNICVCKSGRSGDTCLDDEDECFTKRPCSFPGGYCVNKAFHDGMYFCGCDTRDGMWASGDVFDDHGVTFCIAIHTPAPSGSSMPSMTPSGSTLPSGSSLPSIFPSSAPLLV